MKILQLVTDRQLRGAQVFAAQLTDWLLEHGHDVKLVVLYNSKHELLHTKAPVISLGGVKKTFSVSLFSALRKVFLEFSPDIIQANGSDTLKYTVISAWMLTGRPVIVYRNISMAGSWGRGGLQRIFYSWLFKRVDHVASLTDTTRKEFVSVYRFAENRISVIPIGANTNDLPDREAGRRILSQLTGTSGDACFVLHVGAFSREKNHAGLLRIFSEMRKIVPHAQLVLVGSGILFDDVKNSNPQSVTFAGSRTDIPSLLAGADLLLLPSLIEGLPGVILEAMASKVPVVAYDIGAIAEVVEDGLTGFVVAVNDENQFSAKAVQLLLSKDLRIQMGHAAYDRVRSLFSLKGVCEKFEAEYKKLLERNE